MQGVQRRVQGRSYGQRRPPLTNIIQSILERYPDGGQILKELIQNADDAGASRVSFLLDSRSQPYGTSSLYSSELHAFQGPALYAHNDALFTEGDWEGLQSLMISSKKEDPLKVGRFGIGFNSVYHLTDLPSIVSGGLLAFLDPHEHYFGRNETGTQFELGKPLLCDYRDQFSCYEDILDCKISSGVYNGTLFRFPLRNQPSKLSQKLYNADKVRNLFNSLKEEASLILLFLKSVEEINVYETDDCTKERLVFSIKLKDSCRENVREQRREFLRLVPEWESGRRKTIESSLEMVIEIYDVKGGITENRWAIHSRIGASTSSLHEMAMSLHLLPWVGFAAPLSPSEDTTLGPDGGRIFCFLPLPPDAVAKSGYPVHIHGYFGLTDNRRGLKWPGPECQNDDLAEWNVKLLKTVGSEAYTKLIEFMTQMHMKQPGNAISYANHVYSCWPDPSKVQKNWNIIIEPMMKILATSNVLWTMSCSGRWISPAGAIIERLGAFEFRKTIISILTLAQEQVLFLPPSILNLVDSYLKKYVPMRELSPAFFRVLLKKQRQNLWNMANMNRAQKLAMLEYAISDGNFADLKGIPLLPLADGTFTQFLPGAFNSQNLKGGVFVTSSEHPKEILPNFEARCLDGGIPHNVFSSLSTVALGLTQNLRRSSTRLIKLSPQLVIVLLKQAIPGELLQAADPVQWSPRNGYHPSEEWLVQLWKWIKMHFPYNLAIFEGLPIIPLTLGGKTYLTKLTSNTKVIKKQGGTPLTDSVVRLLRKAGVIVLNSIPSHVAQHPCHGSYVTSACPENVVQVLQNVGLMKVITAVSGSSAQEKAAIVEYLSNIKTKLSEFKKAFLRSLPIFESIGNTFISAQTGGNIVTAAPPGVRSSIEINIPSAATILSTDNEANRRLLMLLGVTLPTMATFMMSSIFPHLNVMNFIPSEITTLMCWVLRRFHTLQSDDFRFTSNLTQLRFVVLGNGTFVRPQDAFDPRKKILKQLFAGEDDKFPVKDFEGDDILAVLCSLGLKQTPTSDDLANVAKKIELHHGSAADKATALLRFLDNNSPFLNSTVSDGRSLKNTLLERSWVPRMQQKPQLYPHCMPWLSTSGAFCKPSEITGLANAAVVGAVMPVLQSDAFINVGKCFGWDCCAPAGKVLTQLKQACYVPTGALTPGDTDRLVKMLKGIYSVLASAVTSPIWQLTPLPWVWTGSGFAFPECVAFHTNFSLQPYLHVLPKDLQGRKLSVLFKNCGVRHAFTEADMLGVLKQMKARHEHINDVSPDTLHDRHLALEILHWIVRDGKPIPENLRKQVLLPVMSEDETLKLIPCDKCTFCDANWLRGNFLEMQMLPEISEFSLIHESISTKTASLLGVPALSKCLMSPEALGFEQAGPYEPITTRLKNILAEYKEGAGVFKELVQNADDAGASEVKFLVDWRQHAQKSVFCDDMKDLQGPALLAYNDAKFSKEDFENINKLAGATKKEDLEKIGRFGLGFNSVYHFTDVPSFLSGNYAVVLDPHMSHLGHFIMNPSRPGIKIDLENRQTLKLYPDQFKPYSGVFGCDVSGSLPFNFDGTLFRFPFRRGPSDICSKQYYKEDVESLLESFKSSAPLLLLNTQNIKKVSVWVLDEHATDPSSMTRLLEVHKEIIKEEDNKGCSPNSTFLRSCAEWSKKAEGDPPQKSRMVSLSCSSRDGANMRTETETWLLCDCMGDGNSLKMSRSEIGRAQGLLPCAGVAAKLDYSLTPTSTKGEAFCFLPLSIPTGLPVHVNGYFAVTSNRRGIWEQATTEYNRSLPLEVQWNISLMEDGVAKAYVQLLDGVQSTPFWYLWPEPDTIQSQVWKPLLCGVYRLIATSSYPLINCGSSWVRFDECWYLDHDLENVPRSLEIMRNLGIHVAHLPAFAQRGFELAGCKERLASRTCSRAKFLEEVFFPNIQYIDGNSRDEVICYILDECLRPSSKSSSSSKALLKRYRCIPCSEQEDILAYAKDIVHPEGDAAKLFSSNDNRFPIGECYRKKRRLLVMQKLGMAVNILTWDQICERAQSVKELSMVQHNAALGRLQALVLYLNRHIDRLPKPSGITEETLASMRIFPVALKPMKYILQWKGQDYPPNTMLSSAELYEKKYLYIIGAWKPILDETSETGCGDLHTKVRKLFRIPRNVPSAKEALDQLQLAVRCTNSKSISKNELEAITQVCDNVYQHLQKCLGTKEGHYLASTLHNMEWALVNNQFVLSKQLAFEWDGHGSPYLYNTKSSLAHKYNDLLQAAAVKTSFGTIDFIFALNKMKETKGLIPLDDTELRTAKCFLEELHRTCYFGIPKKIVGLIPMPDDTSILRPAQDLVINDAPWFNTTNVLTYVHTQIPIHLAHTFGAKDIRSRSLENISRPIGRAFGQKEQLTDRLAGILKSYPCDVGILKELVQNADDAGATEIHFVYDPRTHEGDRVFSDRWKELQGPALCVYNNRPFSEKDLEGIQRLGIGSKGDSPEKTGQYGIGFNAVYHLTDCPSFISNGDTLCILDPHARYAPGASVEEPGRVIGPFNDNEFENYSDVFTGYLGNFLPLKGSTVFRLPLRSDAMADRSSISQRPTQNVIHSLLRSFIFEAKDVLVFLNNVRKISISEVKNGEIVSNYEVSAQVQDEVKVKCNQLSDHVRESKHLQTRDISAFGVTYPVTLQDSFGQEKWLVRQTIGLQEGLQDGEVPDGNPYGLLPRAGVAVKILDKPNALYPKQEPYKAFCFLPLPVNTGLPVHVNGHFALDSGRRHLWKDEDDKGFRSKWNTFMRTRVIADAYVSLLAEARSFIPYLKSEEVAYFEKEFQAHVGIHWYEELFPSMFNVESSWSDLCVAVLNAICSRDLAVLPFLTKEAPEIPRKNQGSIIISRQKHRCHWVSPSQGYFTNLSEESDIHLDGTLREIGFKLLSFSHFTFQNFMRANAAVKQITPEHVISFLKCDKHLQAQLPRAIEKTKLGSLLALLILLEYCMKSPSFTSQIEGLPLLLTNDNVLRYFERGRSVYMSSFSDLVTAVHHQQFLVNQNVHSALKCLSSKIFENSNGEVVRRLRLDVLQTFVSATFPDNPTWRSTSSYIAWEPKGKDEKIAKWLKRLWLFIQAEFESNPAANLGPLNNWPIIPTKSGHLVPVSLSKTVLGLANPSAWSSNQYKVVKALKKLNCPEVDMGQISTEGKADITKVVAPYLAYPHCLNDVITVLANVMKEVDITGRLDEGNMILLLQFFQEDPNTLEQFDTNKCLLKRLPFYKTIYGTFVSIDNAPNVYAVPEGLPLEDSHVWMEGADAVFLRPCQKLDLLFETIGVKTKSHIDCYIEFIFPKFGQLQASTRLSHLKHSKGILMYHPHEPQITELRAALKNLAFIPDKSGALRKASTFFDPENPVFCVMLPPDKRPPSPFDESEWLDFLRDTGLQTTVSNELFMKFAKEVEEDTTLEGATKTLLKKSQTLTRYLLSSLSLQDDSFLQEISRVKFIACFNVPGNLCSVVSQFNKAKDEDHAFTAFRESVPHDYSYLVWSSAALLPDWAVPGKERVSESLGIHMKPTIAQVVDHTKKLSLKLSKNTDTDVREPRRHLMSQVMTGIYTFLSGKQDCAGANLEHCTPTCRQIAKLLHDTPFILVERGALLVKCSQLAFEVEEHHTLPPYLYKVPRHYGAFDHLFRVLGVVEKPTPSQYASILQNVWSVIKGKQMHAEEMRIVKSAVLGLFLSLSKLKRKQEMSDSNQTANKNPLADLEELYLPSLKKELKPSHKLVHTCDCPDIKRRISESYDFLIDLPMCGLMRDRPEYLLGCLPDRLKVPSLKTLVREEIHPDSCNNKCRIDAEGQCSEVNHLRMVIGSKELAYGIKRILKAQLKSATLPEETVSKIDSLKSRVALVCFESLTTRLVSIDDNTPIQGSDDKYSSCFVEDEDGKTVISFKHGASHDFLVTTICMQIKSYLKDAVEGAYLLHLRSIIALQSCEAIFSYLDATGVERDVESFQQEESLESELGSEIPVQFHYLLIQFEDFLFRPNDLVGYEKEVLEETDDEQDPKYVLARIIQKVTPQKRKQDPATGQKKAYNPLLSRYLIDVGTGEPIEVDVLDLYKLKRPEEEVEKDTETHLGFKQALVPYEGREGGDGSTSTAASAEARNSIPQTLEQALEEVRKHLMDILKLPEDKRKKALKGLYLRWHPDKKPDAQELATKVMQFIQSEYERLLKRGSSGNGASNGAFNSDRFSRWFSRMDRTARRQRSSYDNYRRHNRGSAFNGGYFSSTRGSYRGPSASLARVWLVQSRADLESVRYLLSSRTSYYWLMCFQCHQIVENALKAALISASGVSQQQVDSHDLLTLSRDVRSLPGGPDVTESTVALWNYYGDAHAPHKHGSKAPQDVYTFQQAQEAFTTAKEVLQRLEEFVGVLHH